MEDSTIGRDKGRLRKTIGRQTIKMDLNLMVCH